MPPSQTYAAFIGFVVWLMLSALGLWFAYNHIGLGEGFIIGTWAAMVARLAYARWKWFGDWWGRQ
jgi:hypothetical protein